MEELGVEATILRPLWLDQNFYIQSFDGRRHHELCIYFLIEVGSQLVDRGDSFEMQEGGHTLRFEWLPFRCLENKHIYPDFIKTEVFSLPDTFTIR